MLVAVGVNNIRFSENSHCMRSFSSCFLNLELNLTAKNCVEEKALAVKDLFHIIFKCIYTPNQLTDNTTFNGTAHVGTQ